MKRHIKLAPVEVIGPGDEASTAINPLREEKAGRSLLLKAFPERTPYGGEQYSS